MNYLKNKKANTTFIAGNGQLCTFDIHLVEKAMKDVNKTMRSIRNTDKKNPKHRTLEMAGMRNLSGNIGERFKTSFAEFSNKLFMTNPHQDGYPDLLLMDGHGTAEYDQITQLNQLRDKKPFSYYKNGGIEIKACCGTVPTNAVCAKRYGIQKPDMFDTRIGVMTGYTWAAHHRQTTNLMGLLWDFEGTVPQIMAVFFGNSIDESDWGKVSVPKVGGRTTNASGMARYGVKKMYDNWLVVKNDSRYIDFINGYNNAKLIKYNKTTLYRD